MVVGATAIPHALASGLRVEQHGVGTGCDEHAAVGSHEREILAPTGVEHGDGACRAHGDHIHGIARLRTCQEVAAVGVHAERDCRLRERDGAALLLRVPVDDPHARVRGGDVDPVTARRRCHRHGGITQTDGRHPREVARAQGDESAVRVEPDAVADVRAQHQARRGDRRRVEHVRFRRDHAEHLRATLHGRDEQQGAVGVRHEFICTALGRPAPAVDRCESQHASGIVEAEHGAAFRLEFAAQSLAAEPRDAAESQVHVEWATGAVHTDHHPLELVEAEQAARRGRPLTRLPEDAVAARAICPRDASGGRHAKQHGIRARDERRGDGGAGRIAAGGGDDDDAEAQDEGAHVLKLASRSHQNDCPSDQNQYPLLIDASCGIE